MHLLEWITSRLKKSKIEPLSSIDRMTPIATPEDLISPEKELARHILKLMKDGRSKSYLPVHGNLRSHQATIGHAETTKRNIKKLK